MPLDKTAAALHLSFRSDLYDVLRLPGSTVLPSSFLSLLASPLASPHFISLSRTSLEVSIILPQSLRQGAIGHDLLAAGKQATADTGEEIQSEGPWALLVVKGPMELHMTGVMHALAGPLKDAGAAIFASSTFDTDYVLLHEADKEKARKALEADGWVFDD